MENSRRPSRIAKEPSECLTWARGSLLFIATEHGVRAAGEFHGTIRKVDWEERVREDREFTLFGLSSKPQYRIAPYLERWVGTGLPLG